ncbi:unnamed protein product [Linum tenue]|uniref:Uncharacterized protein n=1 Tax=Linum tenue TaxID=586396 RepID=A0AAV0JU91_9ROSI|nr:unnamed protein product [Linum tenue]
MEMDNVLHMNGGMGETSYAKNSLLQWKGIATTLPIIKKAIAELMCNSSFPIGRLAIADLGCASGPNSFFLVSEVIKAAHKLSRELGHESTDQFQIFLNDLPGNDFNNIFRSIQGFKEKIMEEMGSCTDSEPILMFITGVPGSFYDRLFQTDSLHFIHSSYGVHWSSQVPRDQDKLDSFNLPLFTPSAMEVETEIQKQGSFAVEHLELWDMSWNAYEGEVDLPEALRDGGYNVSRCMKALFEPIISHRLNPPREVINEVFKRTLLKPKPINSKHVREREMDNVLHMNGGMGETSYAKNSLLQWKGIATTLPITKEAIAELMCNSSFPIGRLAIANLGCASGPNSLFLVSEVIKAAHKLSRELGHKSTDQFQIFLNDLPGNDFNNIFSSIQGFKEKIMEEMGSCTDSEPILMFITGVPVFTGALKFLEVHLENYSSCSLLQGLIDQDKLDSFNLPLFTPSAMEVEAEIQKQGSFAIKHLELWDMSWNAYEGEVDLPEALRDGGYNVSRCMKALFEPIITHKFNLPREVMNEVFKRYGLLLSDWMANERAILVSLTVSLTKRG